MLIPQTTTPEMIGVLALAVAPLAYLAALSPSFRVAPFTAIIVLLLAGQFGESPVASAFIRSGEVVLGGMVAMLVSIFVFPERAHGLGLTAAERRAQSSGGCVAGVAPRDSREPLRPEDILVMQNSVGQSRHRISRP